ncbi:hypothetical protein BU26DRAFT_276404 [Trematosphaeria pertusa]|uniref:Uncharacterized protein n=1 Tax=Trematosphaeria pertusa TaxID=390896 RepID=A0A6A6IMQ4_9PLEO|nr:uncharacterized protein BU26DRAFT_276404 [Trematosphaeria pertusa]KAF2251112.1 hypothetical protein BU26DRAFT_276404 [Trematosphaeria pertusa]
MSKPLALLPSTVFWRLYVTLTFTPLSICSTWLESRTRLSSSDTRQGERKAEDAVFYVQEDAAVPWTNGRIVASHHPDAHAIPVGIHHVVEAVLGEELVGTMLK